MDVSITENPALRDIAVDIACPSIDARVQRIVASVRSLDDSRLAGSLKGETVLVEPAAVLYIEAVDKKTFIYTADLVLEGLLRLYEYEERLAGAEFVRISKQMLVNFRHVVSLKPDFNARMQMTLSNGEAAVVSRQYSPAVKRKLGLL